MGGIVENGFGRSLATRIKMLGGLCVLLCELGVQRSLIAENATSNDKHKPRFRVRNFARELREKTRIKEKASGVFIRKFSDPSFSVNRSPRSTL